MGKHSRPTYPPKTPGHVRTTVAVRTRHCVYEVNRWPGWLMHETPELIDEVMEYLGDGDDDEGDDPVPAKI